jgi:hypothetical protein
MPNNFVQQQWIFVALVFLGIIFYLAWSRRQERRWISRHYRKDQIIAVSFGVTFFGRATDEGAILQSKGFLLLLADRLVFRSRFNRLLLEIPAARSVNVYHDRVHKNIDLHQSLVKVDFFTPNQVKDTAAFKVPYPPQWIGAIRKAFFTKI